MSEELPPPSLLVDHGEVLKESVKSIDLLCEVEWGEKLFKFALSLRYTCGSRGGLHTCGIRYSPTGAVQPRTIYV